MVATQSIEPRSNLLSFQKMVHIATHTVHPISDTSPSTRADQTKSLLHKQQAKIDQLEDHIKARDLQYEQLQQSVAQAITNLVAQNYLNLTDATEEKAQQQHAMAQLRAKVDALARDCAHKDNRPSPFTSTVPATERDDPEHDKSMVAETLKAMQCELKVLAAKIGKLAMDSNRLELWNKKLAIEIQELRAGQKTANTSRGLSEETCPGTKDDADKSVAAEHSEHEHEHKHEILSLNAKMEAFVLRLSETETAVHQLVHDARLCPAGDQCMDHVSLELLLLAQDATIKAQRSDLEATKNRLVEVESQAEGLAQHTYNHNSWIWHNAKLVEVEEKMMCLVEEASKRAEDEDSTEGSIFHMLTSQSSLEAFVLGQWE